MNPYTIQSGDTLSGLATKYNTTVGKLLNLNPNIGDPNKIYTGKTLNLGLSPAAGGNTTNTIITPTQTITPTKTTGQPVVGSVEYDIANKLPLGTSANGDWLAKNGFMGGNSSGKGYISDSSTVVGSENDVKAQLANLGYGNNDPYTQTLTQNFNDTQNLLTKQLSGLKTQLAETESSIGRQYDTAITNAKDSQEKELASNVVGLARIGGYLGGTASAMGALNNLQAKHAAEVTKLEQDRRSAIQIAQNAVNEKEYNLALKMLESAKAFAGEINQRNKDTFDAYIKLTQENRTQSKYLLDQGEKTLDQFVIAGKTPSAEQIASIAQSLGTTPDVIDGLFTAKVSSMALEKQADKNELDIKLLNVLKDIPAGKYVSIGGKTYAGLKAADGGSGNNASFDEARKYIADNIKSQTPDQINTNLRQRFKGLNDGDINQLMKESNLVTKTPEQINAVNALNTEAGLITSATTMLADAAKDTKLSREERIASAKRKVDATTWIPEETRTKLKSKIDELSPEGSIDKLKKFLFNQ